MAKKSKRYQEAAKLIEKGKAYSIEEAVALVKETSKVKFDAAVDVAFRLGVDPVSYTHLDVYKRQSPKIVEKF